MQCRTVLLLNQTTCEPKPVSKPDLPSWDVRTRTVSYSELYLSQNVAKPKLSSQNDALTQAIFEPKLSRQNDALTQAILEPNLSSQDDDQAQTICKLKTDSSQSSKKD